MKLNDIVFLIILWSLFEQSSFQMSHPACTRKGRASIRGLDDIREKNLLLENLGYPLQNSIESEIIKCLRLRLGMKN